MIEFWVWEVVTAGGTGTAVRGIVSDVYEEGEKQASESRPAVVRCLSVGGEGEAGGEEAGAGPG